LNGFRALLVGSGSHQDQQPKRPHSKAEYIYGQPRLRIYGQPRLRKWQFGSDSRSLAVIYPVSIDPDGFRRTTPNH
jgi:hypothetical protein